MKLFRLLRSADSGLIEADATALIQTYGADAYEEARTRARQERAGDAPGEARPRGHWDAVRREIARRTGREVGADTATRYLES
jgi:hypothetical protein